VDDEEIKKKIWNIELVVEDIRKFPQTYETILGKKDLLSTNSKLLRRKLAKLFAEGRICKTTIMGRFGTSLWYVIDKKYHIIMEASRMTCSNVYCIFNYENDGQYWIKTNECWQLKDAKWENVGSKAIMRGNILKWI